MGIRRSIVLRSLFILLMVTVLFIISVALYRSDKIASLNIAREFHFDSRQLDTGENLKRILIFGDSRAERWDIKSLRHVGVIVNAGIGGETSNSMTLRSDIILKQVSPDVIIFCAGINDLVAASLQKNAEIREKTVNNTIENLQRLVRQFEESGALVIVLSVTPPYKIDPIRWLLWGSNIDKDVARVNKELNMLQSAAVHILDVENAFSEYSKDWIDIIRFDALHYSPEGYQIINKKINLLIVDSR